MRNRSNIYGLNVYLARTTWGDLPKAAISSLKTLSKVTGCLLAMHGGCREFFPFTSRSKPAQIEEGAAIQRGAGKVSQYLRCPRSYRYRYLDGWREKESRAALCFGRSFEKALAALFTREDAEAVLFKEWGAYRDAPLEYSHGDDWERLLRQGIRLLEQFARDNRIRIRQPKRNMQKKIVRSLSNGNEFVAYIDAVGHLDGTRRLLEWKTTSARYPDQPEGLTSLDPQLVCYSWITGIPDVAIVAFVRKRVPEIQYLLATIAEEQRQEFGELVEATARQIETAQFPSHSGIRFPQNACVSCAHLGLCLGNETLAESKLIRQPGAADLDWLDLLDD